MELHSAVFYTRDIDSVEKFYHHTLGLEIEYRQQDAFISFIFSNNVRLGIKMAVEEREIPGAQTIFVKVDDIDRWYEKAEQLKLRIRKKLVVESWGTNFSILDPDGNKVQFVSAK
ncbi:MAG: Glyoxalase-like domain protein [Microgenomates bacterium OLB22]|nr:MAG: Glyoxalase-like domain protein [Microgenomates bacterium OLB22]